MIRLNGYVLANATDKPYVISNFTLSELGWRCKMTNPEGMTMVHADITYVMAKAKTNDYPIEKGNLDFALRKLDIQREMEAKKDIGNKKEESLKLWIDRITYLLNDIVSVSKHKLTIDSQYRGDDFTVIRMKSIKNAKKLMKNIHFKGTGKYTDRKRDCIMIREIPHEG